MGMACKLRLEYPGTCITLSIAAITGVGYSIRPRRARRSKPAFSGCERSGWLLHAYVIMGNHYHLAVETPEGNLIAGMQWLQATFANRFNRLRRENGHLFQGRYKSLLLEDGPVLGSVCDYIHLSPVRAADDRRIVAETTRLPLGVRETQPLRRESIQVRRAQGRVGIVALRLGPAHVVEGDENNGGLGRVNDTSRQQEEGERACFDLVDVTLPPPCARRISSALPVASRRWPRR